MTNETLIYLDDIREPLHPEDGWKIARNALDAYMLFWIAAGKGEKIIMSLDHDLGEGPTGYDLLCWIESDIARYNIKVKASFGVHSANPVGHENMTRAIRSIKKLIDN